MQWAKQWREQPEKNTHTHTRKHNECIWTDIAILDGRLYILLRRALFMPKFVKWMSMKYIQRSFFQCILHCIQFTAKIAKCKMEWFLRKINKFGNGLMDLRNDHWICFYRDTLSLSLCMRVYEREIGKNSFEIHMIALVHWKRARRTVDRNCWRNQLRGKWIVMFRHTNTLKCQRTHDERPVNK